MVAFLTATAVNAQKLVIGSRMPELRGIQWLSSAPPSGKPLFVDFYQSSNKSCQQNIEKFADMKAEDPDYSFVIITRENNDAISSLVKKYGSKYSIGYDATGKIYDAFGVKFVPFSMAFNAKEEMTWQGNVSQLSPGDL